jgi:hypothetical protein
MTDFKGSNGQVHFDGTTVTITREGFAASVAHLPTATIPVGDVVDILIKEAHGPLKGSVFFATAGDEEMPPLLDAKNPHEIAVSKSQLEEFAPLRAAILAAAGRG